MNEVDFKREDPDDPTYDEDIQSVQVPVIHVHSNVSNENVEFLKLQDGEVLKYGDGIVALTDGNHWIKIPITDVNINTETSDIENTFIQITEEESEETVDTSQETEDCEDGITGSPQVVLLEDGRIAYIEPLISEENSEEIEYVLPVVDEKDVKKKKKKAKNYACMVPGCKQAYGTLYHLKVHSRNHTGDRPFKCTIDGCSKAFSTDYSRKAHLRTHTGEKPYSCPSLSCSKRFKTSGDLQKHIRVHTGERPFACPIKGCNRSFTTSNIRKVHIRTHTGEKPYVCHHEGCTRSFASSTNFKNHMRIHSGEKPYCCTVPNCMKRFTEYSSLYKHQLVHSQSKKHQCNVCKKTYRQPSSLNTHKRTSHGVIAADDGTEIILEEMIGLTETGSKNFKDITSKLLKLKRGTIVTIEEDNTQYVIKHDDGDEDKVVKGEILIEDK